MPLHGLRLRLPAAALLGLVATGCGGAPEPAERTPPRTNTAPDPATTPRDPEPTPGNADPSAAAPGPGTEPAAPPTNAASNEDPAPTPIHAARTRALIAYTADRCQQVLDAAIAWQRAHGGAAPTFADLLQAGALETLPRDGWQRPLVLGTTDTGDPEVASPGPDGVAGTADDIVRPPR